MSKSPQIEKLNQSLQSLFRHRRIDVLVDRSQDQLNVLLIKLPGASVSYPGLTEAIKSQIAIHKIPNIAKVRMLGLLQGHESPEWEQSFPLSPIAAPIPDLQPTPVAEVEVEPKPATEPRPPAIAMPEALPQPLQHWFPKIWSIGLGVGIAAVFAAIGYGLGTLNHGTFSDRPSDRQAPIPSQKDSLR